MRNTVESSVEIPASGIFRVVKPLAVNTIRLLRGQPTLGQEGRYTKAINTGGVTDELLAECYRARIFGCLRPTSPVNGVSIWDYEIDSNAMERITREWDSLSPPEKGLQALLFAHDRLATLR